MPATDAQIRANRENAARSTGPKTEEGKASARANAYKHGLTASTVLPERAAAEVRRRYDSYCGELQPSGELGYVFVLRAATLSVRMEMCVEHETTLATERVRQAEADFVAPEGVDEATAAKLLAEAGKRALFDPSKEATLARRYEAAAERSFFRALKELRAHEKDLAAKRDETFEDELGSFLPGEMTDDEFDRLYAETAKFLPQKRSESFAPVDPTNPTGRIDVPISIGKRR